MKRLNLGPWRGFGPPLSLSSVCSLLGLRLASSRNPIVGLTHISSSTDIGKMLMLEPRKLPVSTNAFPGRGDSGFVPAIVLTT